MNEDIKNVVEEAVEGALAEVLSSANFPEIGRLLTQHEKILRGNGRPGLVEDMALLRPIVGKVEKHVQDFQAFEIKVTADSVAVHASLNALTKSVEDGFRSMGEKIKTFEDMSEKFTKFYVSVGFLGFIGGGLLVAAAWSVENFDKIKGWFHGN